MLKNTVFNYQEHKQCACKGCTNIGLRKCNVQYIHKEGWFCEECFKELAKNGLIKEI